MRATRVWPVIAAFATLGCAGEVRAKFARDVSCPDERILVEDRSGAELAGEFPELQASLGLQPHEPPIDVTTDPERLAVWRGFESERHRQAADRVYRVARGCGQLRVYDCGRHCWEVAAGLAPSAP
jgi:hypothetical protein